MPKRSGLRVLEESIGEGLEAEVGDRVSFDVQESLSHGDLIHERLTLEQRIGDRRIIAGLEYALRGMRAGGYRKVRISPHLAYGERGVPDRVPPNAVIVCDIWVHSVTRPETP